MSRWREMIMDYGQMFGTEKSFASTNAYSLGSDLSAKKATDLQLRRTLEIHFRPLFQRFVYGGEKIACHDLRRLLGNPEYRERLPADKVHELVDVADFNRGKAISYSEFVRIALGHQLFDDLASLGSQNELDSELGGRKRNLRHGLMLVCRNTVPQEMVEEKMETYRCLPPPFFIIGITLVQIIAYIVMSVEEDVTSLPLEGVAPNNTLMYTPTRRREVWRYFTYCFLHQGYIDLIFNVVIQLVLGIPLEMMFSWWRMAIVYITGVIVGSCGQSMADHYVGLVGASGGSYAIVAAHIVAMIRNWKSLNSNFREARTRRLLCSVSLRIAVILAIVIPQVALAVYRRFFLDGIDVKIGIAAYFGGILAGASLSNAFLTNHRRMPWEDGVGLICLFMFLIFVGASVVVNITWDDYPAEDYS